MLSCVFDYSLAKEVANAYLHRLFGSSVEGIRNNGGVDATLKKV